MEIQGGRGTFALYTHIQLQSSFDSFFMEKPAYARKRALLIGNDHYEHHRDLNGPVKEAKLLAYLLKNNYEFEVRGPFFLRQET